MVITTLTKIVSLFNCVSVNYSSSDQIGGKFTPAHGTTSIIYIKDMDTHI